MPLHQFIILCCELRDSSAIQPLYSAFGGVSQGNPKAVAADDGFRVTNPAGRFMLVV
jgi:hypothetical protein